MIHLPVEAYTSEIWFQKEQERIFNRTWQFAGFIEDLTGAGDHLTVQAGGNNIMVVRGRDQRLRAFHNMCRHRGTQLLRTAGKACKAITCPYHDWTYSLNGELLSVPQQEREFPQLDKSKLSLHPASVETWKGMIWVHPDPNAESLLHWLGGIQDKIGPHRPEDLVEYTEAASEHIIEANWKIIVENYIDGYHLAHLHSETLYMYDHEAQQTGFIGPHFHFYEPLSKEYSENTVEMAPAPLIDHFTAEKPMGAYAPMLFPCIGLSATETTWSVFHVIPLGARRTMVRTRSRLMPASDWAYYKAQARSWKYYKDRGVKYEDADEQDPMASGDFMTEDVFACEQQQKALASPMFSVGATAATMEASVRGFQKVVARFMEDSEAGEGGAA